MKKILIPLFLSVFALQAGNSQTLKQSLIESDNYSSTSVEKLVKLQNGFTILSYDELYSIDNTGNLLWAKNITSPSPGGSFLGYSIVRLDDGSYVIAGSSYPESGSSRSALLKTDATGNVILSKQITDGNYSYARSIIKTKDGGFALAGSVSKDPSGNSLDCYIIKLDANFNFQWSSLIGGTEGDEVPGSLTQTKDGGYAVTGATYGDPYPSTKMFVAKMNSTGALLWSKNFGEGDNPEGVKIIESSDGGLAVLGDDYTYNVSGNTQPHKPLLVKLTSAGALQWAKSYKDNGSGTSDIEIIGNSFIQTISGDYVITGTRKSTTNNPYSLKTNASGNVVTSKMLQRRGTATVIFANGSGYIMGGYTYYNINGFLADLDATLNTCKSKVVTTVANTSTKNVNANFHKNSRIFTVSPLGYTSVNSTLTVTETCSIPSALTAQKTQSTQEGLSVSIFPNPVKDNLHVQLSASNTVDAELRIINQMGVVFMSKNALITSDNQTEIINTSSLKNGMYFLSVSTKEGNKLIPFSKQ